MPTQTTKITFVLQLLSSSNNPIISIDNLIAFTNLAQHHILLT